MGASKPGQGVGEQLKACIGVAARALLLAFLWVVLHLVGGTISAGVVIATLVAIFGPELLPWESIQIGRRAEPPPREEPAVAVVGAPSPPALREAAEQGGGLVTPSADGARREPA